MQKKINLVCIKCNTENAIQVSKELHCKKCSEKLTGRKYGKIVAIPLMTIIVSGLFGYVLIDKLDNRGNIIGRQGNRYPIKMEFSLIEECSSGSRNLITQNYFIRKRGICFCALEKTQKTINYKGYIENKAEFFRQFNFHIATCK